MLEYISGYEFLVWFYLFSTYITAIAAGLLFYRYKIIMKDALGNFLAGFALCPAIQWVWTLLLAPIVNGGSRYIFIITLPALAVTFIIFYCIRNKSDIAKSIKHKLSLSTLRTIPKFYLIISAILVVIFIPILWDLTYSSLKAATTSSFVINDNLEYFHKANYFANNRTFSSISWIHGIADGSAVADHHFPSYTLYLGYAFMHTAAERIVFPYHAAPLIAMFFQLPFLLAAGGAAVCALTRRKWVLIVLPAMLFISHWLSIQLWSSTRCLFRFTTLLIVFSALYCFFCDYMETKKIPRKKLIFMSFICFIAASSHLLNFVALGLILAACAVWQIMLIIITEKGQRGTTVKHSAIVLACFSIAAILSFSGNIYNFIVSGRWNAVRLDFTQFEFYPELRGFRDSWRTDGISPLLERLTRSLELDHNYFTWFIFAAFIYVVIKAILKVKKEGKDSLLSSPMNPFIFTALCCLTAFIPLSGLIDHPRIYEFSVHFSRHPRYGLQFFLFGVLLLLIILAEAVEVLHKHKNILPLSVVTIIVSVIVMFPQYGLQFFILGILILLIVNTKIVEILRKHKKILPLSIVTIIVSVIIVYTHSSSTRTVERYQNIFSSERYMRGDELFIYRFEEIRQISESLGDKKILMDRQRAYIFDGRAIVSSAPVAAPIFAATNEDEMRQAFKDIGVSAVLFSADPIGSSFFPWFDFVVAHPFVETNAGIIYFLE